MLSLRVGVYMFNLRSYQTLLSSDYLGLYSVVLDENCLLFLLLKKWVRVNLVHICRVDSVISLKG